MRGLCYTCLSQNRNVKFLENFNIKRILRQWFKAGGAGKVNLDEFKLCWECTAWLIRIFKFKHQVFMAHDIRFRLGHKKSTHFKTLTHLSTHTKNTYDNTYEYIDDASGLNSKNESISNPDERPSNVGEIPKKKISRKPENGKQKLSITLRKNKEKAKKKHSNDSDYDSYEIKENTIVEEDDETDSNDNNNNTQNNECGENDLVSTLNVSDISKDVKLRSQPVVLLEREKEKKGSSHSKHKKRKRKHEKTSDEVTKDKAKKQKRRDATDDDPNDSIDGPNITKASPNAAKIGTKSTKADANDTIAPSIVIKIGSKAAKGCPNGTNVDSNATKVGTNTAKVGPKSSKIGPNGTNVDPNAKVIRPIVIKIGPKPNKVGAKTRKDGLNANKLGPKTNKVGPKTTKVASNAVNVDPNAGTIEDTGEVSRNSTPDLPEVKFTIVHLTEEQMIKTREIDKSDRLYANRAFKCQTCIIGFLESTEFEKHVKEKHNLRIGTLVCQICDTRFNKPAFLELHQKTHYRSYRCRLCPFEHHRRFVIETHVVKEHGLKPSPVCPDCDMDFDTPELLEIHFETDHKERLKCNACGESFDTYAQVKTHAQIHKAKDGDIEVIPEIYHCVRCNCIFEGRAIYRAHMQYAHMKIAQNAYCADCDVQFTNVHKYKCHLEDSLKHTLFGKEKFDCAHCMLKFLTKGALLAHIVRAHRLLSHTCALCNKGFSDQARLKNHIHAKHPEVVPDNLVLDKVCQICGKAFFARSALLDHMRSHTAEKPYQCKYCDKRFAAELLLKKHIQRMHKK